jgi:hypothetical protein
LQIGSRQRAAGALDRIEITTGGSTAIISAPAAMHLERAFYLGSTKAKEAGEIRTWHDAGGQHSVKAAMVDAEGGIVELRKADGSTIKVPIEKLSDADQQYIRRQGGS